MSMLIPLPFTFFNFLCHSKFFITIIAFALNNMV